MCYCCHDQCIYAYSLFNCSSTCTCTVYVYTQLMYGGTVGGDLGKEGGGLQWCVGKSYGV